jgi:cell division protein FtsB
MSVKWLTAVLFLLFILLQYRLWFPEGSKAELARLQAEIQVREEVNAGLRARNRQLELEVLELQDGLDSLEERAREDLGMIKEGETYYQIVDREAEPPE